MQDYFNYDKDNINYDDPNVNYDGGYKEGGSRVRAAVQRLGHSRWILRERPVSVPRGKRRGQW